MTRRIVVTLLFALLALDARAAAHNEFQTFVRKNSGRPVDCALCHVHSNGPEGTGAGQVGSLNPEELTRLGRARAAFDPGTVVDSPILNDFGDSLVQRLGKKRILELRSAPVELAREISQTSDLDLDGIPDASEYVAGTHPLIASDGNPWSLFLHNLRRSAFHLLMLTFATALGLFGLINLLHGFALRLRARQDHGHSSA